MGFTDTVKSWFGGSGDVSASTQEYRSWVYDGEKYPGGLPGVDELLTLDYWALRQRSAQLFHKNAYARGIVRRIVTNVIATGLHLEAKPLEEIIGRQLGSLEEWSETVEQRYYLYNNTPKIIDYKQQRNGWAIQRQALLEAIVGGDCLVVLRQSVKYKLPVVQIIQGDRVRTPLELFDREDIVDGVQLGKDGSHVGFYVTDSDSAKGWTYVRAKGQKTGRVGAFLLYGCDRREDGVRGEPLLSIAIQPLAEIDKYRDSAQRKATLNSLAIAAIERDVNSKKKSKPITGRGAKKRGSTVDVVDSGTGEHKSVAFADLMPGLNFENLEAGEKVNYFNNNGVDINFGAFEAAIMMGLAWALEIPPEILLLSFNKNYSASQAAINEFKIYLNKERERFGAEYCNRLYQEWFHSMVLLGKIQAGTYLSDLDSANRWDVAQAWTAADWTGAIKPSTDMLKATNSYTAGVEQGYVTRTKSARELHGTKFSANIRALKKENQMMADAMRPLLELQNEFSTTGIAQSEAVIAASAPESSKSGLMSEDEVKRAKLYADTYGVGVRAGTTTPQTDDEKAFREMLNLPKMSKNVLAKWAEENGTRQPITLASEADQEDPANKEDDDADTDDTEQQEAV